jgi:hypothetical protein
MIQLALGAPAQVPGGLAGLARLACLVDLYGVDKAVGSALEVYALRHLTVETAGDLLSAVLAAPGAGCDGDGGGGPLASAERAARTLAARQFILFSSSDGFLRTREAPLALIVDDDALEVRCPSRDHRELKDGRACLTCIATRAKADEMLLCWQF